MTDDLERLVLQAGPLRVEVMPALGGKVSSLTHDGVELLQQPLRPYTLRTPAMRFEDSDASGFDECLSSVAACEIAAAAGTVTIPDHGEIWRLECEAEPYGADELRLTATEAILPLQLERTLKVQHEELRIDYWLENMGATEIPYIWSAHPLFSVEAGDAVVLPSSVNQVAVEGSAHGRLGSKGRVQSWPVAETSSGRIDLSRCGQITDGIGDKLFVASPAEGWLAIDRRRAGLRVQVNFDPAQLPYCGLWLCYGGWPDGQPARQQCVALEPCTASGDSLAEALEQGFARRLAPGERCSWWMTIAVNSML